MTDMEQALQLLQTGKYTCVACKNGVIHAAQQRGVRPLLNWLDEGADLMGAAVADRVVGWARHFCTGCWAFAVYMAR